MADRIAALNRLVLGGSRKRRKPPLHLWSAECNLTRRVLAITDHSEHRLALAVERFGSHVQTASNLFGWSLNGRYGRSRATTIAEDSAGYSRNNFPTRRLSH